mmetsp:Transcript_8672/g.23852  ORF Transcript_8672/g.23852 Transcript_8672/m.23852 type:complete len:364 (+) Transcript_8672:37-1128(+)
MPRVSTSAQRDFEGVLEYLDCSRHRLGPSIPGSRRGWQYHGRSFSEVVLEAIDFAAGIMFVVGSVFFLPSMHPWIAVGCWLFIVGSIFFVVATTFDLLEALQSKRKPHEALMYALYTVGSAIYVIGTVFYFPAIEEREDVLGGSSGGLLGALLFTVGSLVFVMACFVNGALANVHPAESRSTKLLVICSTNCTMLGSCCFLVGSVLYIPALGCDELVWTFGTWLFIVGSGFFVLGSMLRWIIIRTSGVHNMSLTSLPLADMASEYVHDLQEHLTPAQLDAVGHQLIRLQRKIHDEQLRTRWMMADVAMLNTLPSKESTTITPSTQKADCTETPPEVPPEPEVWLPTGRMCGTAGFEDEQFEMY